MCGILCFIQRSQPETKIQPLTALIDRVKRRGPDSSSEFVIKLSHHQISLIGCVLHQRGTEIIRQPFVDSRGNVLLFNGEIFEFNDNLTNEKREELTAVENDTEKLSQLFSASDEPDNVPNVISTINGPFSFVYWQESTQQLWFGRDYLGRRSLCELWNAQSLHGETELIISSLGHLFTSNSPRFNEISVDGIYFIDFSSIGTTGELKNHLHCHFYQCDATGKRLSQDYLKIIKSPLICPINDQEMVENLEFEELMRLVGEESQNFLCVLEESIRKRVQQRCHQCHNCFKNCYSKCIHSSLAILFSGGIDCTVMTALALSHIPAEQSIDLLNVSFSQDAPDRKSGIESYEDLCRLFPQRKFNFVSIDIESQELEQWEDEGIKFLIEPLRTGIDISVGTALWFASRGRGKISMDSGEIIDYQSPARIVLNGLGADEILAGYTRFRAAFEKNSWQGVYEETAFQMRNLPYRNLGRDDRCISDHGVELRLPYLDENVINYCNALPLWIKADFRRERGLGEKLILRVLAKNIGLERCSSRLKKALQFGSKIAPLMDKIDKKRSSK